MTIISPDQLIGLILVRWNPTPNSIITATAVMGAESGGDTNAISPSSDYGLFQINRIHFGDGTITSANWRDVSVQLNEMWRLSGGMTNFAAWCTMWANPGRDCGHGFVNWPQPGSAADGHLEVARQAWARFKGQVKTGGDWGPPATLTGRQSAAGAWSTIQRYASHGAPGQWHTIDGIQRAMVHVRPR